MADKAEYLQAIDDAILDADSLERFINGSDSETVLTRLSANYPTIKNMVSKITGDATTEYQAIFNQLMKENNIAGRFKTLAALQASLLEDDQYALVSDDSVNENNGIYIKESGVWVKSKYSTNLIVSEFVSEYLDENLPYIRRTNNSRGNIFEFYDNDNKLLESTDPSGGKNLIGLSGSVQDNLNRSVKSAEVVEGSLDNAAHLHNITHAFCDSGENIQMYLDNKSKLMVHGLEASVQDEINKLKNTVYDVATSLTRTEVRHIPERIKGNYSVTTEDLLSLTVPVNDVIQLNLDTPYRKNDSVIHPDVITLDEPMRGYKHLLCVTPYYKNNTAEENPVVYGSNNKINWEMLSLIDQPLDSPPQIDEPWSGREGYLSDNFFAYDPINKELLCCYRKNYYADGIEGGYTDRDTTELLYRKTTNGLQWSPPIKLAKTHPMSEGSYISPSMFYDKVNSRWVLFWQGNVCFNSTLDPEGWSEPVSYGLREFASANKVGSWHYGMGYVGDKLVVIYGNARSKGNYYIGVSQDDTYLNWAFTTKPLIDGWESGSYRGTFLVDKNDNTGQVTLQFYFTRDGSGLLRTGKSLPLNFTAN